MHQPPATEFTFQLPEDLRSPVSPPASFEGRHISSVNRGLTETHERLARRLQYIPTTTSIRTHSLAGPAVINTSELREMILLELYNKTLLLSQRVSKNFKATIDESTKVQEKLYFRQGSALTSAERARLPDQGVNTLICKMMPGPSVPENKPVRSLISGSEVHFRIGHTGLRHACEGSRYLKYDFTVEITVQAGDELASESAQGSESWRRMYLFQPTDRYSCMHLTIGGADKNGQLIEKGSAKRQL